MINFSAFVTCVDGCLLIYAMSVYAFNILCFPDVSLKLATQADPDYKVHLKSVLISELFQQTVLSARLLTKTISLLSLTVLTYYLQRGLSLLQNEQ